MRPFAMERWQSTYENIVTYNLSESGVHALTLQELLELARQETADHIQLSYGHSNGSEELRALIAAMYPGANISNVLATVGGAEANFVATWALAGPGTEVACVLPSYMQTYGLAEGFGARINEIHLREELGWQPDPDDIRRNITGDTKLVVVTNPNNPTGAILAPEPRRAIIEAADAAGAWILADEVYAGAEMDGRKTPSFWEEYPRTMATGSLSKAYGLPGLRVGWVVAPADMINSLWARTDYTTISNGALTDSLACFALAEPCRAGIGDRTRRILLDGLGTLQEWASSLQVEQRPLLSYRPPEAGAICFFRYHLPIDSGELAERLRKEKDVLVVPGDHFGLDKYFRIGYGLPGHLLEAALDRVGSTISSLAGEGSR